MKKYIWKNREEIALIAILWIMIIRGWLQF